MRWRRTLCRSASIHFKKKNVKAAQRILMLCNALMSFHLLLFFQAPTLVAVKARWWFSWSVKNPVLERSEKNWKLKLKLHPCRRSLKQLQLILVNSVFMLHSWSFTYFCSVTCSKVSLLDQLIFSVVKVLILIAHQTNFSLTLLPSGWTMLSWVLRLLSWLSQKVSPLRSWFRLPTQSNACLRTITMWSVLLLAKLWEVQIIFAQIRLVPLPLTRWRLSKFGLVKNLLKFLKTWTNKLVKWANLSGLTTSEPKDTLFLCTSSTTSPATPPKKLVPPTKLCQN